MMTCQAEMMNICMVEREDCVLVQHRVRSSWQGSAFPGGHVDPGESVAESMVRELREETGLTAPPAGILRAGPLGSRGPSQAKPHLLLPLPRLFRPASG